MRIIKINMVEGTNESFLARKLSELRFSNSSGPCACIHLLLVSIVRSFTLQYVYTRKGTSKRFVVVHYQVSKCNYSFLRDGNCTIILASYELFVFSTAVYTLRNAKFNVRIIKINMVEGTNESFLARKLSELRFSNSSVTL